MFKILFWIIVAAGAYFYASPYLAVKNLTQGLENEDVQTVDQYVDFDAVKLSFQNDFAKKMNLDTQGSSIADTLATGLASVVVNTIVSPENMISVLKDKDRRDRLGLSTNMTDLLSRGSWVNDHEFVLSNDDGKPTALLSREGLQWQVTALRVN